MTPQRVNMITLAVKDIQKSRDFYSRLGFVEATGGNDNIAFFKLNDQWFSLYLKDALTNDLCMPIHGRSTGTITLATNYGSREEVDQAYAAALDAGAICITKPTEVFWGGYSGNYADPDGHLWEIAHNPYWTLDEDGNAVGEA